MTRKKLPPGFISGRELADKIGVSETAIRKFRKSVHMPDNGGEHHPTNGRFMYTEAIMMQAWKDSHPDWEPPEDGDEPEKPSPKKTAAPDSHKKLSHTQEVAKWKAKTAQQSFEEKAGTLVNKTQVYKALHYFGDELKRGFLTIPDAVVDAVMDAKNRRDGKDIIMDAIRGELLRLSEIDNLKL